MHAYPLPPATDYLYREVRRVVISLHADRARVGIHIVDAIRNGLAQSGIRKTVHLLRLPRRALLPAVVFELDQQLLLLGVDAYHVVAGVRTPRPSG